MFSTSRFLLAITFCQFRCTEATELPNSVFVVYYSLLSFSITQEDLQNTSKEKQEKRNKICCCCWGWGGGEDIFYCTNCMAGIDSNKLSNAMHSSSGPKKPFSLYLDWKASVYQDLFETSAGINHSFPLA